MTWSNRVLQILTLHCDAASALASRELDEALPRLERVALRCHLILCRSCRRYRRQIGLIRQVVRRREPLLVEGDPNEHILSTEARNRIARAIREAGGDEGA
jgi:predicted anti-sigma-YlaC factor YlaD